MYFLQFMKWFWNEHLDQTSDKVGFCLIMWVAGLAIFIIVALFVKTPLVIIGYLLFSIGVGTLFAAFCGIMYMYQRYNEWQMQVIHKLKGE